MGLGQGVEPDADRNAGPVGVADGLARHLQARTTRDLPGSAVAPLRLRNDNVGDPEAKVGGRLPPGVNGRSGEVKCRIVKNIALTLTLAASVVAAGAIASVAAAQANPEAAKIKNPVAA